MFNGVIPILTSKEVPITVELGGGSTIVSTASSVGVGKGDGGNVREEEGGEERGEVDISCERRVYKGTP